MKKDNRVELLAPAGSPAAFYGAVNAGADAVYLGGSKYGARAYAENFTQEELVACIRYGRLFGVKIYLTVNTLLKERELACLPEYLAPFYEAGLDAVIVQDIGVLRVIRENFPGLHIHASTQMTICDTHGTCLLKEMGASRVVPARELGLKEIIGIKDKVDIEIEAFVHGAMCYCYSGQCLFSSILGGRSGNRGRCAQPCRLPYSLKFDGISEGAGKMAGGRRDSFYPLSLKDMCTVQHIGAFIEAGIDSFKIEGRMKKPEYAAGVTAIYRKYIDLYYELRDRMGEKDAQRAFRVEPEDVHRLSSLYIRSQIQDGYYFRQNGREMITLDNPGYSGTEEELLADIRSRYLTDRKKLAVKIEAEFFPGQPAKVLIRYGNVRGEAVGEPVQTALKQPISEDDIRRQLGKLGDTPFRVEEIQIKLSSDAFYQLKRLNELRRQAAWDLEQSLTDMRGCRPDQSTCEPVPEKGRPGQSINICGKIAAKECETRNIRGWSVSVRTLEQLKTLVTFCKKMPKTKLKRIYVDGDLQISGSKEVFDLCHHLKQLYSCQVLTALPYVLRQSDEDYLEQLYALSRTDGFDGFLIRSLDGLGFLTAQGDRGILRGDTGLYTWNSKSAAELSRYLDGFCLPFELNVSEQMKLLEMPFAWEKVVYGRIPMMITANCLLKTTHGCKVGEEGRIMLFDRYRKGFPVLRNCRHCSNIIYNCVPLSLHKEIDSLRVSCEFRIDFTLEKIDEIESVLNTFWRNREFADQYTTGHDKRGVE